MLEHFYRERRSLADFRRGPLGAHFDDFAGHLERQGYSHHHAKNILGRSCQLNYFLIERGVTRAAQVNRALIEAFRAAYLTNFRTTSGYSGREELDLALKHLFVFLAQAGILKLREPKPARKPYDWMLDPYLRFLHEDRQVTDRTVEVTRKKLCAFLDGLGKKVTRRGMKSLSAATVEGYAGQHVKDSPHNLLRLVSALRGFLQFCARQRYTATDLSGVIPSVPRYRLASLPRGIDDAAIDRMLKAVSQDTPAGLRDYAILMLLTAYGLRGQQIAELRLDDITWPRSLIRIRACKGGKEVVLPLLEAVGEAILRYLRHRPANTPFRHLFLAPRAPHQPATGMVISQVARRHIKKAGLKVARCGTSTLRHSWAIRALTQGSSIKTIADMLGHRWVHNTFIYAKADLNTLREVALPWPGERS